MPCDGGYGSSDYDRLQRRLDRATRAACEMEKVLKPKQYFALSESTQRWLERHRLEDKRRRQREADALQAKEDRKQALAKLTEHERFLLSLPDE
jgi:DNA-binding PadR family transcriptional regulator